MTPALRTDIPAADYHADRIGHGDAPSLSSSVARTLIQQSAIHAWLKHPKFGNAPRESTADMDRGTLIHALVFGTDPNATVLMHDNYRTKAAQAERDRAIEIGSVPILFEQWEGVVAVADAIQRELTAAGIELSGVSEAVATWQEETPAGPVLCRGMLDHLLTDQGVILDLKTARDASPRKLARVIEEHGYDIQAAAYRSFFRQFHSDFAGREKFRWLFVETVSESPVRVVLTVAEPSGAMRELGEMKWARACEAWARCLASGKWPGYSDGVVRIEPPSWAMAEEITEEGVAS